MAWLIERHSARLQRNIWHLRWREADGKLRSRSLRTSDKSLAEVALREAQRSEGKVSGPVRSIDEAFHDFQRERSIRARPGTLAVAELAIRPILEKWVDVPPPQWSKSMLVEHVKANPQWSPRTVRIYIGDIRRFIRWCHREGVLVPDFTEGFPIPRQRVKEPESFSQDQVEAIMREASVHPYIETPIALAIYAGLDPIDFTRLTWADIDLDVGVIVSKRGKTGQPIHVPIVPPLLEVLKKHTSRSGRICRGLPKHHQTLRLTLNRLVKRAGIKPGGGWKKFRHTFGTRLGLSGAPLATIRSLMAHTPTSTATLRYLHTNDENKRAAILKAFGGS